ncbi:MAG: hypothetical protein ABIP35_13460 [Ginsengibacter sp.]
MKINEVLLFSIGLILFSIVVIDLYWWIEISSDYSKSFDQAKKEYLEKLPSFISKGGQVAVYNIILLTIAGFLFFKAATLSRLKIISKVFFVLCIAIGAWQVFSLM